MLVAMADAKQMSSVAGLDVNAATAEAVDPLLGLFGNLTESANGPDIDFMSLFNNLLQTAAGVAPEVAVEAQPMTPVATTPEKEQEKDVATADELTDLLAALQAFLQGRVDDVPHCLVLQQDRCDTDGSHTTAEVEPITNGNANEPGKTVQSPFADSLGTTQGSLVPRTLPVATLPGQDFRSLAPFAQLPIIEVQATESTVDVPSPSGVAESTSPLMFDHSPISDALSHVDLSGLEARGSTQPSLQLRSLTNSRPDAPTLTLDEVDENFEAGADNNASTETDDTNASITFDLGKSGVKGTDYSATDRLAKPDVHSDSVDDSVATDVTDPSNLNSLQMVPRERRDDSPHVGTLRHVDVPRQVAESIRMVREQTGQTPARIEIQLDPPELGRMSVELTESEHGVVARITANQEATAALVDSQLTALKQSLQDAGVSVSGFHVSYQFDPSTGQNSRQNDDFRDEREFRIRRVDSGAGRGTAKQAIASEQTSDVKKIDLRV